LINHIYILTGVPRARGVGGTTGASSDWGTTTPGRVVPRLDMNENMSCILYASAAL